MNEADRLAEASRWLRYAQEDLETAESVLSSGAPRQVCWLAQQSAEKALKAALVFLQVDFPRTHDLDVLLSLIPDDWAVKAAAPDLAELSEWAVEARYPGSWPEATTDDATRAVADAKCVFHAIQDDFARRLGKVE